MSKQLVVGVVIGGAISSAFTVATSGTKKTLAQLGAVTEQLQARQARLGNALAQSMAHPMRSVGRLRQEYTRLGQTIDQLHHKQMRLGAGLDRAQSLKQDRAETAGKMRETVGAAIAVGAPVFQSVRLAAGFQDQMRDIAITGEFNQAQENQLGSAVRAAALNWNQTQAEIGRGMGVLVAGGIQDAKALEAYAPVMAKAATATRASMDDLGSVVIALRDNLKIGESGFEGALNMLAYAGKRGQFEIRDMAKWLPQLSPMFASLGVTGKEAVAEIGAALQVARKGAGTNDEAANNFRNFLAKLTSADTKNDFKKVGVDIEKSMMSLRAKGLTPLEAMLGTITAYLGSKGPQATAEFMKAMKLKDEKERQASLERLSEAYRLSEIFQDMQAMNFIRPAIANADEMKDIKKGSMDAADKGLLDEDYKKRLESATEQFKTFKIGMADIGITLGDALLPPLNDALTFVRPLVVSFGAWVKEHPGLIRGVVGLVGGLLGLKMVTLGAAWGFNFFFLSTATSVKNAFTQIGAKWTWLRALWQAGKFAPLLTGLRSLWGGFMAFGRFLVPFGKGLLMFIGAPLTLAAKGIFALGRALLLTPIGLLITGIGIAAFLVYRYWKPITGFFQGVWARVTEFFSLGIGEIARKILDWSPVGLFYKGFASVLKLFGIELPDSFSAFGGMLIDGLVGGVTRRLTSARDAIVSFGSDIKGWFTSTLGIKSPSRVFMGFGDNIAEGAALGIERTSPLASRAAAAMAAATAAAGEPGGLGSAGFGGRSSRPGRGGVAADAGGSLVVHFSPTINLPAGALAGAAAGVKSAVMDGLQLSLAELERLMDRVLQQRERRSN